MVILKSAVFYVAVTLEAFIFCFAGEYLSAKVRIVFYLIRVIFYFILFWVTGNQFSNFFFSSAEQFIKLDQFNIYVYVFLECSKNMGQI